MLVVDVPRDCYHPSGLTHPTEKELQNKFRFFEDCLRIMALKAGEFHYFEIATHASLIKTLQYSIELAHRKYDTHSVYTAKQVKYIIETHPLLQKTDRVLSKFYPSVFSHINTIVSTPIRNHANGKNDIILVDNELKAILSILSNYLENIVHEVNRCITCKHKTQYHKADLEYYAKLVFSFFYMYGYSRGSIAGFVSLLLAGKVEQHNSKIHVTGVLPEDLAQRIGIHNHSNCPFNEKLLHEAKTFFQKRGTHGQINSLLILGNCSKSSFTFLFRIDGIHLRGSEMQIGGLRLINTEHFRKLHNDTFEDVWVNDFLVTPSALVEYVASGYSYVEAKNSALIALKRKLDRMSHILKKSITLNLSGYLTEYGPQDVYFGTIYERVMLTEWDAEMIGSRETIIKKPEFKLFMSEMEHLLAEAHAETDISFSLNRYSRFTEILTAGSLHSINHQDAGKNRVLALAFLLLLDELENVSFNFGRWAYHMVINAGASILKSEEKDELRKFRNRKKPPSLNEMRKAIKHEHTRYRINMAYKAKTSPQLISAFHYYVRQLGLLVQYRNIHEHENKTQFEFERKLKSVSETLLSRVLIYISKEFNNPLNANKTPQEVLNTIFKKGQTKVDALGIRL